MRSTFCLFLLLSLCCVLPACASEPAATAAEAAEAAPQNSGALETEDQKTLYALGQALGQSISQVNLSADELALVQRGLGDIALGNESLVDMQAYGSKLQSFMQQRMQAAAEKEKVAAAAFVDQQAAAEGAVRTETGIVIKEITAGTGAMPVAEDTVKVHYHGTLRDGSIFDSSRDRGEPATFPLNGVIRCWTEGLQTLKVGGKSLITCPSDLAYGPQGRPPSIPGNAALVFEVELLEIVAK